jgi:hypothetical protein
MSGTYARKKNAILKWRENNRETFDAYMHEYYIKNIENTRESYNKKQSALMRFRREAAVYRNILL